jgi:hypothetical protein
LSILCGAETGFFGPPFFPELCLERAMAGRCVPERSIQIVHPLGRDQGPRASVAIASGVESFGPRHGGVERGLRARIRLLERAWRRLLTELRSDWRTACSNCAILLLQGPACADAAPSPKAAATIKTAVAGRLMRVLRTLVFGNGMVLTPS